MPHWSGRFLGIFLAYALAGPLAVKMKYVRDKRLRLYIIVKQTLLAYMNGSLPQVSDRVRPQDDLLARPAFHRRRRAEARSTPAVPKPRRRREPCRPRAVRITAR